ncbi:carbon-nitrogen hydrolase family protein [Metabacillus bambusae]|uniref:Carbon-nitrogen hydrolase family protein n=1 Tax=Metabacillus bambusae TaxID=2795218 RepID=A0ABS3NAC4_9BACI|nr:carbon-nitrogen hydrolase family protein [Metabacillus bambusae]MBO1515005.1 carbon-nitrogen hydrolase family protein [Metabacillus bambusae]
MVKIAIGQITPETGQKNKNLEKMKRYTIDAAEQGAKLVVFPELALTGYNCGDDFFDVAEPIPGDAVTFFKEIATQHDIYIIWGMPEKSINGILYNAAVLVGPEGYIGSCRKNTLPGHATDQTGPGAFPDRRYFKAGENLPVFDTAIGKIGILICYDIFFPELARLLTLKGADIIVGISGSPTFEKDIFEPIVKARAMENTINFVYTNLVGQEGETTYWGGGCIIGAGEKETKVPGTPVVCKAPYEGEGITIGDIDIQHLNKIRPYFPVLRDITTRMYEQLADAHRKLT